MKLTSNYLNRNDAGKKLIPLIRNLITPQTLLFAIPRGGIAVAKPIAFYYSLPLYPLLVKKISHPDNEELAIGACGLNTYTVENERSIDDQELKNRIHTIRTKLLQTQDEMAYTAPPIDLSTKSIVLIDDGAATGQTLLCAIRELKQWHPKEIVLVVPIASSDAASLLRKEVDKFICPFVKDNLQAVGTYYTLFDQVSNQEVRQMLTELSDQLHHKPKYTKS